VRSNHRDAVDFLSEVYGIAARVEHKGTKHPRLVFTHKGEDRRIPIAGSTSDTYRGSRNMEAQLRSELGPPDPPALARVPRRLEAMQPGPRPAEIPPAPAPAADILRGGLGLYDDNRLRFKLPQEVVDYIAGRAVFITRPLAAGWRLIPDPDPKSIKPRVRRDGNTRTLDGIYSGDILTHTFGMRSPADYMIGDGYVEVDLLLDQLVPVEPRRKPERVSDGDPLPTELNDMPPFNNALEGLLDAVLPEPESPLTGVDLPPAVDPLIAALAASPVGPPKWLSSKEDTLRSVRYYEQVEGIHRMQRNKATGRMRWVPAAGIIELEDEA